VTANINLCVKSSFLIYFGNLLARFFDVEITGFAQSQNKEDKDTNPRTYGKKTQERFEPR
jgi:hypothetical protein